MRWTDLSYIAEANEWYHANHFWGGEAFPGWNGGYPGHTTLWAFLGCPVTLDQATGWVSPVLENDDWGITTLRLQKEGRWWQFAVELLKTAAQASEGKSIASIGAFGGCGDDLAAVRGTEALLYDCVEQPEKVAAASLWLMDRWCEVYETFAKILDQPRRGATCWFQLWAPERYYATQCDFGYNISPKMFRELFLPALERQTRFLKYAVHHLDGVGNFMHLPVILELPGIKAIQVVPGAGKPSALHYLDVLKQVQAAGRNLVIYLPPQEIQDALAVLSAKGLLIETSCRTEQEARDLLQAVEGWSRE